MSAIESERTSNRRGQTILILDNEDIIREVVGKELRQAGYETVDFANKEDGYDWVCENHADLIISDINSRTMDGFSLLRYLKANAVTKPVPVVIVTGFASLSVAIETRKLGAIDFVPKPYELDDLLLTIKRVLADSATRRDQKSAGALSDLFISTKEDVLRAPWYRIRKLLVQLVEAQQSRTILFDQRYWWSEYFLIEDRKELVGCCLCRPNQYGSLPGREIYSFKSWLDSQGLQFGVMYSFFDAEPGDVEFAELLGISLVPATSTLEMLLKTVGQRSSDLESLVPSERGLGISPLAGEFQAFWSSALRKAQDLRIPVVLTIGPRRPGDVTRLVKCEFSEYGSFNFRDESNDTVLWLSETEFCQVVARIWRRRRIEHEDLSGRDLLAFCIGEVLELLGLATRSENTYYLKGG